MPESKTHKVTLIPGDGIGPEVTQAVVRILEATGVKWEWERFAAGAEAFEIFGEYIPSDLSDSIARNKVALKGPVTTVSPPLRPAVTSIARSPISPVSSGWKRAFPPSIR